MTVDAPPYDLTLVIDPQADDAVRAKIVADTRAAIEAQGEVTRYDDWGERPLAYPIERRTSGEYHLFQFHPQGAELLHGLDRTLRITDGLLRFRIIKLKPGVPPAPDLRASTPAPPRRTEAPAESAPTESAPTDESAEASEVQPQLEEPVAEAQPSAEAPEGDAA